MRYSGLIAVTAAFGCGSLISAIDNGLGITPTMGWRAWNQFECNINQGLMQRVMDAMVDRSRSVNGVPMSLADLGYSDVGLDDCWQSCGSYGPDNYTYHDAAGNPIINTATFPSLSAMTAYGHARNLTVGWYHNNCHCSDHCNTTECYQGDVNAVIAYGFDSVKLDGCGAQWDLQQWADLFNATGKAINIENCHWGDTLPTSSWCPWNFYRTSQDARPIFGSVVWNANTVPQLASANLSTPGCWAYPDMLEIGVTNRGGGLFPPPPLSYQEGRSNFFLWCILSSPLVLGMDVTDGPTMDSIWDVVSNTEAIAVNQQYAGFSGSLFAQADTNVTFAPCTWFTDNCSFPVWQQWYKPLPNGVTAVLLVNNGQSTMDITVNFSEVPGLSGGVPYKVRDIAAHMDVGTFTGSYTAAALVSHDSAFLLLSPTTLAAGSPAGSGDEKPLQ